MRSYGDGETRDQAILKPFCHFGSSGTEETENDRLYFNTRKVETIPTLVDEAKPGVKEEIEFD